MPKPLIIANWKMNPASARAVRTLLRRVAAGIRGVRGVSVVVAPPFPYLAQARAFRRVFALGAQDVFWEDEGAYTGAVSPRMLRDLGVRYCIIGHSERRRVFGESDEVVNRKVKAALKARLIPIIAIGEEHRESQEVVPAALARELSGAIAGVPKRSCRHIAVAYEPVWAISTTPGARPDTPDNATRRAIYIRKLLTKLVGRRTADAIPILYGGSVNAKNAVAFLSHDIRGMEGLLVGGASLRPEEFGAIVKSVARRR